MADHEISLWMDKRWYDAITEHFPEGTLEERLYEEINNMILSLPEPVFQRINTTIQQEQKTLEAEREAARKFTMFRVTKNGEEQHFQVERKIPLLTAAGYLRLYLRREQNPFSAVLTDIFQSRIPVSPEAFEEAVSRLMEGAEKVVGVYDADFDAGNFSFVDAAEGRKSYAMNDISTAVFYADRKQNLTNDAKLERFLGRLNGKELTADEAQVHSGPTMV